MPDMPMSVPGLGGSSAPAPVPASAAPADRVSGPVGQGDYVVRQGECVLSIAFEQGFFWETLWDLGDNSELKRIRENPHTLQHGDRITVPELRKKEESKPCEEKHRFRRKGVPAKFRLKLLKPPPPDESPVQHAAENPPGSQRHVNEEDPPPPEAQPDEPWAGARYVLVIDGKSTEGVTGDDGLIEEPIPPNARRGMLTVEPGTPDEMVLPLSLGALDPVDTVAGAKQRLINLGFDCGETEQTEDSPDFASALTAFQIKNGLDATGLLDQTTQDKIKELHGS